jgi:iron(III) transport system substrate-binding protein
MEETMGIFPRRTLGVALLAACMAASPGLAQISPEAEKALHEAAKKEGEFTWYTAHYSAETAEKMAKAFMTRYPGVKVNVVRTTANVAYQRLNQELRAGQAQVDVFGSTDMGHFLELKPKGILEKYVPANATTVLEPLRNVDADGLFHCTSVGVIGITYNTNKVKPADVPKNWPDLVDPKWRNQVSVGHPAFSGYVGIWVYTMTKLYGWDYFEKLEQNRPQIGRSIQDTLTMLKSGERSVAAASTATAIEAAGKGDPVGVVYPTDGVVVVIAPQGIIRGTRRLNAAKLFMEWSLSEEASKVMVGDFGESLHANVPGNPGGKPLKELKTLVTPGAELLKGVPPLKEKWRDTFGN